MRTDEYFVLDGVLGVRAHLSLANLVQRVLLVFRSLVFGFMERSTVIALAFLKKMTVAFLIYENF